MCSSDLPGNLGKLGSNFPDAQFSSRSLLIATLLSNSREIKDLRSQINEARLSLEEPQTKPTSLASQVYAPNFAINKRPVFTFGISLMLGILIGLLFTGFKKIWPALRKQLASS